MQKHGKYFDINMRNPDPSAFIQLGTSIVIVIRAKYLTHGINAEPLICTFSKFAIIKF